MASELRGRIDGVSTTSPNASGQGNFVACTDPSGRPAAQGQSAQERRCRTVRMTTQRAGRLQQVLNRQRPGDTPHTSRSPATVAAARLAKSGVHWNLAAHFNGQRGQLASACSGDIAISSLDQVFADRSGVGRPKLQLTITRDSFHPQDDIELYGDGQGLKSRPKICDRRGNLDLEFLVSRKRFESFSRYRRGLLVRSLPVLFCCKMKNPPTFSGGGFGLIRFFETI